MDETKNQQEKNYHFFGHQHILIPLRLDEGERINCKACELIIVEPFHGCLSCCYYLHDHCLDLSRSLEHPSHPSHPLTLLPMPTNASKAYNCDACSSQGNSFSYSCAHCDFDIHLHCASMPKKLKLLDKHPHELKLTFNYQCEENTVFICDLCNKEVGKSCWRYYCAGCDFGTHLECAKPHERAEGSALNDQTGPSDTVNAMRQVANEMMETQNAFTRIQNQVNLNLAVNRIRRYYY